VYFNKISEKYLGKQNKCNGINLSNDLKNVVLCV